jgi:hypothetical protein
MIASTLELPYRSNNNEISAIPTGIYSGRVREDGAMGWRIEFDAIPGRSNIQIHPGNRTSQIEGCLLIGTAARRNACTVENSRAARDRLKAVHGSNNARAIQVRIESG